MKVRKLLENKKMGWKIKSVIEQKLQFIKLLQSGDFTKTALCDSLDYLLPNASTH